MAKDTFYFSHDYNARNDLKIKRLLSKRGIEGYGVFWAIIEDLYNNTNVLRLDYETLSYDLRCSPGLVESVITEFDLFVIDGDIFGSHSVQRRLEERNSKSEKARESVLKRWNKDTNVLPTNNDSNTIKESIVSKVTKEKDNERAKSDVFTFDEFWEQYPNKAGKKISKEKFAKLSDPEKELIRQTLPAFIKYKKFPEYNHPNPATYLHQKRWEDEIPVAGVKKSAQVQYSRISMES